MYVKMMGDGTTGAKPFRMWQQVVDVEILQAHDGDGGVQCKPVVGEYKLCLTFEDKARLTTDVKGSVYVLNDQGKTVESFMPGNLPRHLLPQPRRPVDGLDDSVRVQPKPDLDRPKVSARRDRSDPEGGIPGRG